MIVTDENFPILGIKNKQNYYVLICKDIVNDKPRYYVYAPGWCLLFQCHPVPDLDTNVDSLFIHFTFKIEKNVNELVLPLPKEISKEISKKTVTFPSGKARIIYKRFFP